MQTDGKLLPRQEQDAGLKPHVWHHKTAEKTLNSEVWTRSVLLKSDQSQAAKPKPASRPGCRNLV